VGPTRTSRRVLIVRKLAATVAVLAVAAGLAVFAASGSFDNRHDPFPQSVIQQP
jgi:hypothetical protein